MKPLPGVSAEELGGLDPDDALTLWQSVGVSGDPDDLKRMFATFGNYPLLVRALAGEVANSRSAPGNFELWKQENQGFDPFALPLVQVKTHVLAYALANLNAHARKTLNAVAAFRSPVPYDTLRAVRDADGSAEKAALDADLTELEDRGLVGWDRANNAYDLHPVVRNVVWNTSGESSREGVLDSITGHFESASIGGVEHSVLAVKSQSAIEYYYALVRRGRFEDAVKLYRERFGDDLVSIARSGRSHRDRDAGGLAARMDSRAGHLERTRVLAEFITRLSNADPLHRRARVSQSHRVLLFAYCALAKIRDVAPYGGNHRL
jgi:hypothetical protein